MPKVDNEFMMQCMRGAQWEKAKGELLALLQLFPGGSTSRFDELSTLVEGLVSEVEEHELWA